MNYTTNFNLNKPEGTDLYNHLTVDNPNMDTIDSVMQANKLASVGAATELVSGTVHAITRSDSNQNIFKFKATGDFKAGDTITVDGVSVNAYTTGGQQLLDDAYVLSAEVLCILDGTSLWVLTNRDQNASEVSFDNTGTTFNATNSQDGIVEAGVYMPGDSYAVVTNEFMTFTARLGFSRTKMMITFDLPKKIAGNLTNINITIPGSAFVCSTDGEIHNATVTNPEVISITNNKIVINTTISTVWTSTTDAAAVISFRNNELLRFIFS